MKAAINKFSAVICLLGWSLIFGVVPAWSQAALLPNAKQTFLDQNGNPLSNGKVFSYVPNTQVPKTTWSNSTEGASNANPVILDAAGRAVIYGQGDYQQTVTDAANNQQWSALTTAYGSSQPSGSNGTDTAPVGTVMAWAGFTAPTNWAFAYGQTMSRTTFAALMAVITLTNVTTSCVNTSTTISGLADTSQIPVGAPIEASCLPVGTTVSSISSGTSVVVSQAATLTGTVSSTIFPWGNGNGTSTFTAPDLRGRTMAGADAMGGVAASRLTSTFYGASAATPAVGGGAQSRTASTTLAQANLPNVAPTFTGTQHTWGTDQQFGTLTNNASAGSGGPYYDTSGSLTTVTVTVTPAGTISSINGGVTQTAAASAAFPTVQPTLTVNYIIKVAANTTGLGGVTSFGGMFGDIVCASTLTCAPVGSPAVNTIGCTTATLAQIGCVEPDGTTITVVSGKISAITAVASIAVGTTTITGATGILQNNAGVLNSLPTVGTGSVVLNTNPALSGALALTGNQTITWNGSVTNSLNLNTPSTSQLAELGFQSNGVTKWSIFKDAADAYNVFDVVRGASDLLIVPNGNAWIMPNGGNTGVGLDAGHSPNMLLSVKNTWGSDGSGHPYCDVRALGAGLGNATNDVAAFNNAYSTCNGGLVFIPCGAYFFNAAITVPPGTHTMGAGIACTVIQNQSSTTDVFTCTNSNSNSHTEFDHFMILGTGAVNTGTAPTAGWAIDCNVSGLGGGNAELFHSLEINGTYAGVAIGGTNSHFDHNRVENIYGPYMVYCPNGGVTIEDNQLDNNSAFNATGGGGFGTFAIYNTGAATAYTLGQIVLSNSSYYVVTQAGTSAPQGGGLSYHPMFYNICDGGTGGGTSPCTGLTFQFIGASSLDVIYSGTETWVLHNDLTSPAHRSIDLDGPSGGIGTVLDWVNSNDIAGAIQCGVCFNHASVNNTVIGNKLQFNGYNSAGSPTGFPIWDLAAGGGGTGDNQNNTISYNIFFAFVPDGAILVGSDYWSISNNNIATHNSQSAQQCAIQLIVGGGSPAGTTINGNIIQSASPGAICGGADRTTTTGNTVFGGTISLTGTNHTSTGNN